MKIGDRIQGLESLRIVELVMFQRWQSLLALDIHSIEVSLRLHSPLLDGLEFLDIGS